MKKIGLIALLLTVMQVGAADVALGLNAGLELLSEMERKKEGNDEENKKHNDFTLSITPALSIGLGSFEIVPFGGMKMSAGGGVTVDEEGDESDKWDNVSMEAGAGCGLFFELYQVGRVRLSIGPQASLWGAPVDEWLTVNAGGVFNLDIHPSERIFFRAAQRFLDGTWWVSTNDGPNDHDRMTMRWLDASLNFGMFVTF